MKNGFIESGPRCRFHVVPKDLKSNFGKECAARSLGYFAVSIPVGGQGRCRVIRQKSRQGARRQFRWKPLKSLAPRSLAHGGHYASTFWDCTGERCHCHCPLAWSARSARSCPASVLAQRHLSPVQSQKVLA